MNILSFGEIIWDVFGEEKHIGGAPFNFAAHCAALGSNSWLLSAVGDDELGRKAIEQAGKFRVNSEYISVIKQKSTGKCMVELDENAVPAYEILDDVAYDYIQVPQIKTKVDVIAFGTLALRHENNRNVLREILNSYEYGEIFADVNIRPPFYSKENIEFCFENATIIKISDEELPIVTKSILGNDLNMEETAKKLCDKYKSVKIIIITKGEKGSCCYIAKTEELVSVAAEKVKVVSTVGAGDSFGAAFLVKYMENKSYEECLGFASKISAFVCTDVTAVPENMTEITF